jgi:effector-associated domain 2 (EAD2)-containing protein
MQKWQPSGHCALFVCDVVGFGDPARHMGIHQHVRDVLYTALRESFNAVGIGFDNCYREDRGDGVIVVPPPDTELAQLVAPLIEQLRGRLRRHNQMAKEAATIGLRVALHVGHVKDDGNGLIGAAIIHVHRILEAPPFKQAVASARNQFGLIVSSNIYQEVVLANCDTIDPDEFEPVEVQVKETNVTAWMRVPGIRTVLAAQPAQTPQTTEVDTIDPPSELDQVTADRFGRTGLQEIVERLMDIPPLAPPEGRQALVNLLRAEIAIRIPRRTQAHLDLQSILLTCLEFPGGLRELLEAVRTVAGDTLALRRLTETVRRYLTR